jgi:hypothetical protein
VSREGRTECKSPVSLSPARSFLTMTHPLTKVEPMTMVNSIFDLLEASPAQLAELTPEQLLSFQQVSADYSADAAKIANVLHATLAARFATGLNGTGTHHLDAGTVKVAVTIPKKVKWDQAKLAVAVDEIKSWGEDPANYVETEIKVSERKYDAWPPSISDIFTPARTVETGKPVIKLSAAEAQG